MRLPALTQNVRAVIMRTRWVRLRRRSYRRLLSVSISSGAWRRSPGWRARRARAERALAVFPEAFLPGVSAWDHVRDGRRRPDRRGPGAVPALLGGLGRCSRAGRRSAGGIAAENSLHLVIGVIERDGGTLYCTALFFAPDGYLGKHRKLMPTAAERLVWGFGDGSTLPVFDTPLGRIGAVICWENYMPLLRMAMYAKGVQIYCAPTADGRETWLATMRHIALEGRCFVLVVQSVRPTRDFPADFPTRSRRTPDDVVSTGGSCIIDPLGQVLAGPARDGEEILIADIDLDEIARGKFDFDVVGHYARPDVFRLIVDEAPTPARRRRLSDPSCPLAWTERMSATARLSGVSTPTCWPSSNDTA